MGAESDSADKAVAVEAAARSDTGTERPDNEDACVVHIAGPSDVLLVIADGVGGEVGGEVASQMAVEAVVRTYRESNPALGPSKRLYRAVQQANIEIYDRAQVVTELRRMSTTLTAVAVVGTVAYAAHVGDSRLYLARSNDMVQKTKDHTVAASRAFVQLAKGARDREDMGRSVLTRSVGRELIAAVDRLEFPVTSGDMLLSCSDGLYNVLDDVEVLAAAGDLPAQSACAAILSAANERGTPDNLSVGIVRVLRAPPLDPPRGWRAMVARFVSRQ